MIIFSRLIAAAALLLSTGAARALDGPRPNYVPSPVINSTGSMLQITFSLLLVLGVIVAIAWLLKRLNIAQQGTGKILKVIGSVSVGQRERVVLVEVGETWLVVGVGPGQIRTLHTLEKMEDWQVDSPVASENKFGNLLSTMLGSAQSARNKNAA